jgi:hypothetical protein
LPSRISLSYFNQSDASFLSMTSKSVYRNQPTATVRKGCLSS